MRRFSLLSLVSLSPERNTVFHHLTFVLSLQWRVQSLTLLRKPQALQGSAQSPAVLPGRDFAADDVVFHTCPELASSLLIQNTLKNSVGLRANLTPAHTTFIH